MSASIDGSESVDQFLARVASLSNRTGAEDAERSRKMEEEILLARKERQARRAERARSLSPSKTGPASSLPSLPDAKSTFNPSIEPPIVLSAKPYITSPTKTDLFEAPSQKQFTYPPMAVESSRPLPPRPDEGDATAAIPINNATTLSRSGTLSWQQRPLSRDFPSVRSRPLSRSPVSMRDAATLAVNNSDDTEEMSRKDIAESLGAKDPSWFRQTQERGISSPALRKGESENDRPPSRSRQAMRLPGMSDASQASRDSQNSIWDIRSMSEEPPMKVPDVQVQRSNTTAEVNRPNFVGQTARARNNESVTLKPTEQIGSTDGDGSAPNRSSSFLASSRSPSPTKGLGGFVQSAMMKRSDSVNKRWSVQANSGLKRGDSVVGSRPSSVIGGTQTFAGSNRSPTRDSRSILEGTSSPLGGSRPSSSHAAEKIATPTEVEDNFVKPSSKSVSPVLPSEALNKAKTIQNAVTEKSSNSTSDDLLPRSPSKTMDPRRWSPTKSSWLESALSKPESPRASVIRSDTPAWKVGLQRSKAEKESQRIAEDQASAVNSMEPAAISPTRASTASASKSANPSSTEAQKGENNLSPDSNELLQKPEKQESSTDLKPVDKDRVEATKAQPVEPTPLSKPGSGPVSSAKVENTAEKKPPVLKPKPQTPPKTDFRAGLKSRHAVSASTDGREPEFLSMFGKLKRTQPQNYVAPDELKENIAQGKAALNVTGGPVKTRRVDEFKESILQQKDNMKAGSMHRRAESTGQRNAPPDFVKPPVPEALARQKTLHRASSSKDTTTDLKTSIDTSLQRTKPQQQDKSQEARIKLSKETVDVKTDGKVQQIKIKEDPSTSSVPEPNPMKDVDLLSQSSEQSINARISVKDPKEPIIPPPVAANQAPVGELPANSKLAARLNPALAGFLSRGGNNNTSAAWETSVKPVATPSTSLQATQPRAFEESRSSPLTHATKGRAKGPKRRTPKTEPMASQEDAISSPRPADKSEGRLTNITTSATMTEENTPEMTRPSPLEENRSVLHPSSLSKSTEKFDVLDGKASLNGIRSSSDRVGMPTPLSGADKQNKSRPMVAAKSPELRKVSSPQLTPVHGADAAVSAATVTKKINTPIETPNKTSTATPFSTRITPNASVKKPVLFSSATTAKERATPPIRVQEDAIGKIDYTPTKSRGSGLGLDLNSRQRKTLKSPELTPPPEQDIKAISIATETPGPEVRRDEDPNVRLVIERFFGTLPQARDRADFDTQALLAGQKTVSVKTKSINNRIWEVNGDGKMVSMPPNQEHILFEDCMYLCVHNYEAVDKSKTCETYLWCGEAVAEGAIEDAQLFCRKTARENNAKLQVLKQGKEPSNFFQALGGIVIVRKSKSSALYMLCGRRYLGHVSFDEVDFSVSSLCTGFPYIISAKFGKLYLWKGHGSGADEIGCARLIGMDLGLTGEIEEVSEGQETSTFWDSFPTPLSKPILWSEIWSARDQHNGYPSKLFRVEHDRPKSSGGFWGLRSPTSPPKSSSKALVEEISPFCQKDLEPQHLYILDAYHNVYLFVGSAASSKASEFATALQIAQELAVLTPSLQDRSLLPKCQVVFGEPPQDFKAAFRKWTPQRLSNEIQDSTCIPAEAVFKVLGM